jgi:NADH-quinone oxidoreductase subunit N
VLGETNLLGPELLLMVVGGFLLIADLVFRSRALLSLVATGGILGAVLYSAILLVDGKVGQEAFGGVLVFDEFALFFQFLLAGAALVTVAASWDTLDRIPSRRGEYLALILFSTTGLMLLAGTRDLIGIFVALELTSLSQYVLVGFRKDRLGSEAGLKYLLLGAIASAVLLYGMAMLLGLSGSTDLRDISDFIAGSGAGQFEALIFAAVFLIVGFGFKAAVAPFQMWVPDVYTGGPTPVAAFLSVASKAAAFAILIRVFFEALGDDLISDHWSTIFAVLATLSMFVGNLIAIQQTNIKRMLAYSSIAQAGTLLIGLAAISAERGELLGASGVLFYLAGYTATNLAAFLVIIIVHEKIGSFEIDDYRGLGRRAPVLGAVLAIALLSLTGLPPTAGFFGKLYLFDTAVQSGLAWLAVIGVVNTVIAAAYYIRPIKLMFVDSAASGSQETSEAGGGSPADAVTSWLPSPPLGVTLALTTAGIVVIGLVPGLIIDVAEEAVSAIML